VWLASTERLTKERAMIVCRPYIQARLFNLGVGIGIPVIFPILLKMVLAAPPFTYKIVCIVFLPLFTVAGLYFVFYRCVWALRCDEDKRTLTFIKTFRKKTYSIRHINELTVFKTVFGFDYYFKVAQYSFTFSEMDNMPELIAYLKKVNPQIDIGSPEDHKYF
jgi:hypothetical protein